MAKSWRNHHHMQSWRDWPTLSFNHHLMVALYFIHDVSSCVQMATPFLGVDKRMEICLPFGGGYFLHFAKVLQIHRGFTESRCTEACDMRNGHGIWVRSRYRSTVLCMLQSVFLCWHFTAETGMNGISSDDVYLPPSSSLFLRLTVGISESSWRSLVASCKGSEGFLAWIEGINIIYCKSIGGSGWNLAKPQSRQSQ